MKKLHKIVDISYQNENTLIGKFKDTDNFIFRGIADIPRGNPRQLLLLSDDKINAGDKVYVHGAIVDAEEDCGTIGYRTDVAFLYFQKGHRKIIAAYPRVKSNIILDYEDISHMPIYKELPTFTFSFVQEWIKNPVDVVEVEYKIEHVDLTSIHDTHSNIIRNSVLLLTEKNEVFCNIPKDNRFIIIRNNFPIHVIAIAFKDLDTSKCSSQFLTRIQNMNPDQIIYVKCNEDGSLDLRGKKQEYRMYDPSKHDILSKRTINDVIIDKAAEKYANINYANREPYLAQNYICKHSYKDGIKSLEAKVYHTQNMVTKEEMYSNMQQYMEYCKYVGYITPMDWMIWKEQNLNK